MRWDSLVTLATSLAVLGAALIPLWRELRRNTQATEANAAAAKANAVAIEEVHHIVNQQRTDMVAYQAALEAALRHAGVPIPPDASLDRDEV